MPVQDPLEEWERIRSLLRSEDPAQHAQAVELLAVLGDPWLYDQVIKGLAAKHHAAQRSGWEGLPSDLKLVSLDTRHRLVGGGELSEALALRVLADAPPGAQQAAWWRAVEALRLNHGWPPPAEPLDLSPLRAFRALRWLEVGWTQALAGAEALDDLPALAGLMLIDCKDLSSLSGLRLARLERLLAAQCGPLPPLAWPRLERAFLGSSSPLDLAPLAGLPALRSLQVQAPAVRRPAALARLSGLEALAMKPWDDEMDWSFLAYLPSLRRLELTHRPGLPPALAALSLEALEYEALRDQGALDLAPLRSQARLRSLAVHNLDYLPTIRLECPLPQVEELRLAGSTTPEIPGEYWSFFDSFPELRRVVLRRFDHDHPALWAALARLPRLESLRVEWSKEAVRPPPALAGGSGWRADTALSPPYPSR